MHASLNVGYQGKSGPGKIHVVILVLKCFSKPLIIRNNNNINNNDNNNINDNLLATVCLGRQWKSAPKK